MKFAIGSILLLLNLFFICGVSCNEASTLNEKEEREDVNPFRHLTIHIVAHTHDDVGWQKTVDEYYYGANQTIFSAGVQYILDTVYSCLMEDEKRVFVYAEMAYFWRWWREQPHYVKHNVRKLVAEGRLEFVGGGWTQNDEGCTHFEDTTLQLQFGHQFLLQNFGVAPTIGWQLDTFGHSNSHAMLSGLAGFQGIFFARIDWEDYDAREADFGLELLWRPSYSWGSQSDIYSQALYNTSYCFPYGFDWEKGTDPVQSDHRLFNVNIKEMADMLVGSMRDRGQFFKSNDILALFGCDFRYQNAIENFKNMDKLITYINEHPHYNMKLIYSSPSRYLKAVNAANISLPLKEDDFFPYSYNPWGFFVGYYTSRPALKGYVRTRSNLYQAVQKFYFTSGLNSTFISSSIEEMVDPLGIAQHHDAITGTEQQHVTDDYCKRLSMGTVGVQNAFNIILSELLSTDEGKRRRENKETTFSIPITESHRRENNGIPNWQSTLSFEFCEYLNMSICAPLEPFGVEYGNDTTTVPVVFYNPIAWDREEYVRLPVNSTNLIVLSGDQQTIPANIISCEDSDIGGSLYTLIFPVSVPPLGFSIYYISQSENSSSTSFTPSSSPPLPSLENDFYILKFSSNNTLESVLDKTSGELLSLSQEWLWYNSSYGAGQMGGAYIMRLNSTTPYFVSPPDNIPTIEFVTSEDGTVQEARQIWSPWLNQTIRLYPGQRYIEVQATVGPVPIVNPGIEVFTRFQTNIPNNKTWYTDAQGLEMQKRILDHRDTWDLTLVSMVAGNYYPVNTAVHFFNPDIPDSLQFSVVTDRSVGATSLVEGQLDILTHRRFIVIEGAVHEPLNDSSIIRTVNHLTIAPRTDSPALERQRALLHNHPLLISFGAPNSFTPSTNSFNTYSPLNGSLPINVHLQSLEFSPSYTMNEEYYGSLLRLHHNFGTDEDPVYSVPVTVDISTLLLDFVPEKLLEVSLTANQPKANVTQLRWTIDTKDNEVKEGNATTEGKRSVDGETTNEFVITLQPMDIRTFLVRFVSRQ